MRDEKRNRTSWQWLFGPIPNPLDESAPSRSLEVSRSPYHSSLEFIGGVLLLGGIVLGLYALNMDTSVETAFGRVNNIGLISDKQNYVLISAIAALAGIVMLALAKRQNEAESANQPQASAPIDPFDELDIAKANERKRHAIVLGIVREQGSYRFADRSYENLEDAIAAAEASAASAASGRK